MSERITIAERQAEIQAELDKAAKDARTAARNAKKEFIAERKEAVANAVFDDTDAMDFDVDLFCQMMAGEYGEEFKKRFAACYGIKDNEVEEEPTFDNNADPYEENYGY